jgi:hypothetical protein
MLLHSQVEQDWASRTLTSRKSIPRLVRTPLVVLAAAAALLGFGTHVLAAQAPNTPPPPVPADKPIHPHKRPSAAHPLTPADSLPPAPVTPPAPQLPNWPANDKPAEASVTWDSQGLRINATNSSLQQILNDVSTATGAKVEGLGSDERVFGAYGPGQARDILSQLLQGSGYNVIMIGDQGQGTPRQIVLSPRQTGSPQPAVASQPTTSDEDADVDEQPQQQQQQPVPPFRPGFAPGGGPPRTPQQALQERQQQQQQQQPSPSPGNPPN